MKRGNLDIKEVTIWRCEDLLFFDDIPVRKNRAPLLIAGMMGNSVNGRYKTTSHDSSFSRRMKLGLVTIFSGRTFPAFPEKSFPVSPHIARNVSLV